MVTEVIINKVTDKLTDEGFNILNNNVITTNKLLINKAKDSIMKNRKTKTDITRPVNCDGLTYYIRFSISIRKEGLTPISYRILDSNESSAVSFEGGFATMAQLSEVVDYVNNNLGKIR